MILGGCRESSLVMPVMIMCDTCEERVQELLSQKTRDVHEDFMQNHFPGIPANLDLRPTILG